MPNSFPLPHIRSAWRPRATRSCRGMGQRDMHRIRPLGMWRTHSVCGVRYLIRLPHKGELHQGKAATAHPRRQSIPPSTSSAPAIICRRGLRHPPPPSPSLTRASRVQKEVATVPCVCSCAMRHAPASPLTGHPILGPSLPSFDLRTRLARPLQPCAETMTL